ncbi:MAG TPA: outer membrane beta-barrel protein [Candidatus Eisenbacteria bacterium]
MFIGKRNAAGPGTKTVRTALLALAFPLLLPVVASASQGVDVFVFGGYTTKSELDGAGTLLGGQLTVDGAATAGISLGTTTPQNIGIEAMWTHQWSGLTFDPVGGQEMSVSDMSIEQFHANFLFYPPGHINAPTKPYFLIGLGANIFNPSREAADSETRFTWALGLGLKRAVNEKVGFRAQLRYTPTYIGSNDEGYWCDPYYGCYTVIDPNYLDQWDFTGGLVFNLGRS